MEEKLDMETIVNFAKSRGFIYQGSEIYGGLSNTWDYGPLGINMKNNIKNLWIKKFVTETRENVLIDAAILMNPKVWKASGHIDGFSDPLIDCKKCKTRHRADKLIENWMKEHDIDGVADGWSNEKTMKYIKDNNIVCPNCGALDYTDIRQFNLMFKTYQGVTVDNTSEIFLRPETAQGIFVNFKEVLRTTRRNLPMGIAQIGKSFRNEITPGNFIFRTREFEQMELEFFINPKDDDRWFKHWKNECDKFVKEVLGIKEKNLRFRQHTKEELSHYSKETVDIEYLYPFGWGEVWGIANRTNFDLTKHTEFSNQNMEYLDPKTNEKYMPYCIEPSVGVDRLFLAALCDAYTTQKLEDGERIVLKLDSKIAPYKVAVLPLSKKLSDDAYNVYDILAKEFATVFDDSQSIGKRYRRQDEIGTPFVVTYDFDSIEDKKVTVRNRDTMEQVRIEIDELTKYLNEKLK